MADPTNTHEGLDMYGGYDFPDPSEVPLKPLAEKTKQTHDQIMPKIAAVEVPAGKLCPKDKSTKIQDMEPEQLQDYQALATALRWMGFVDPDTDLYAEDPAGANVDSKSRSSANNLDPRFTKPYAAYLQRWLQPIPKYYSREEVKSDPNLKRLLDTYGGFM